MPKNRPVIPLEDFSPGSNRFGALIARAWACPTCVVLNRVDDPGEAVMIRDCGYCGAGHLVQGLAASVRKKEMAALGVVLAAEKAKDDQERAALESRETALDTVAVGGLGQRIGVGG